MTIKELENNYTEFIDYVYSFYGPNGLYPLGVTKGDIKSACLSYILTIENNKDGLTWGGGDSIDRERVRDIIESPSRGLANYTVSVEFYNHKTATMYKGLYHDELKPLLKRVRNWESFKQAIVFINEGENKAYEMMREIKEINE